MVNTIVTAFINIDNGNRTVDHYIEYGKQLLSVNTEQIIFIERYIFYKYFNYTSNILQFCYEGKYYEYMEIGNKIFVFFEKLDNYLYKYDVTKLTILTDNPTKDTIDYMFIICHKTEWMKMATKIKEQNTFIWVDFGVYHMIKPDERTRFHNELERMKYKKLNKIRIASWYGLQYPTSNNIYERPLWYFAGTVFGGPSDKLVEFATRTKEKCLQIISEKETLIWEGNVWYMIYLKCPELFDSYMCTSSLSVLFEF